jgi:hypothetical protein
MKKNVDFCKLVENAFDFLDKASREFESEPKYSVIPFYAALELFLKARLLHEHWTLILTKPETADLLKFQKGDFHSVSLAEAQKRLTSVIQQGLTNDEFNCFRDLGDHRNRMVHFFHPGQHAKKSEIETIVGQQCRAWFYLHRVLTQSWQEVFKGYKKKIASYNKTMHQQRKYLAAKFEQLKPDIDIAISKGSTFHVCFSYGHESLEEDASDSPLLDFNCRVCDFTVKGVEIECPKCKANNTLIGEPWYSCHECGHHFDAADVKSALSSWYSVTKDNMFEPNEASCGECQSHLSVALLKNGEWMCSNCFTLFDDSDIAACEWCNEFTTESLTDSYWAGCEYCEGSAGRHADRDD